MNGKGDDLRPVDPDRFSSNWDRIFGQPKKKKAVEDDTETPQDPWHVRNAKHLITQNAEWEEEQKKKRKKI